MRMWNVPPEVMCRKHLLGEHVEMHMATGSIQKGISMKGYVDGGLLELHNIFWRHEELAEELTRRGYNHHSPMVGRLNPVQGQVNTADSLHELARRCPECAQRQKDLNIC